MASERQINRLSGMLALKMIRQQISLTNRSHISPPPSLTRGGNDELEPNTADLRVDLDIQRTSLFLSLKLTLGLLVGFISSHLTAGKLFQVNSRAITGPRKISLLREVKGMPALTIKRLSLLRTRMTLVGT